MKQSKKNILMTTAVLAVFAIGGWFLQETQSNKVAVATEVRDHAEEGGHEDHGDEHAEGGVELTPEQIKESGIELVTVSVGSIKGQIDVPGQVMTAENRRALVVPKAPGIVAKTFKNIGDSVEKGDVLAIIESRDMAEAGAEYLAAESAKGLAQNVLAREKSLWEKKITAEQDYLNASNTAKEAEIRYDLAVQKLQALGHSRDAIKSMANQKDRGRLRFHELISPISGRVVQKNAILGAHVDSEQMVYDVADTSVVWVEAAVPENDGEVLSDAQDVRISQDGRQASGRLIFVSPVIDPATRSIKAIAEIQNDQMLWRPGSFVTLSIATGAEVEAIVVPQSAIQTIEGKTVVFVQGEHGFDVREVQLGQKTVDMVEIVSGLEGGEVIAAANSFVLKAELGKSEAGHEH